MRNSPLIWLFVCLYPQISDSLQRDEFAIKYKLAEKFEHVEQLMVDSESNHTIWWRFYTNEADEFRLRLWPTMTLHCILRYCCNMYLRLGCLSATFLLYCTTGKWTGLWLLEQSASQEGPSRVFVKHRTFWKCDTMLEVLFMSLIVLASLERIFMLAFERNIYRAAHCHVCMDSTWTLSCRDVLIYGNIKCLLSPPPLWDADFCDKLEPVRGKQFKGHRSGLGCHFEFVRHLLESTLKSPFGLIRLVELTSYVIYTLCWGKLWKDLD